MTGRAIDSTGAITGAAYVSAGVFGAFWGIWGAAVPRVQHQAGVDEGQLGVALLFIGAGALPSMLLAGRALDRWGPRVGGIALAGLGVAGAVMALTAVNLPTLCVGLAVVGATSGAADVGINAVAGRAETAAGRPVITRAHGFFSILVVSGSLVTGLAAAASLPLAVPFLAVSFVSLAAGVWLFRTLPRGDATHQGRAARAAEAELPGQWRMLPLLLIGVLGAFAFASENAQQSWSAVFAEQELGSGAALSSVAPAVFAGTVAITRFAVAGLKAGHARTVLIAGASAAAAGAGLIGAAPTLLVAAVGLAAAAAGTAVLFPTLIGILSRNVDESHRGRATSVVTTVSYLGFVLGPVYVGLWADALGIRAAMFAVAALGAAFLLLAPTLLRVSGFDDRRRDNPSPSADPDRVSQPRPTMPTTIAPTGDGTSSNMSSNMSRPAQQPPRVEDRAEFSYEVAATPRTGAGGDRHR